MENLENKEIENIKNIIDTSDDLFESFEYMLLFEKNGYKYIEGVSDEDKEDNGTNVTWYINFKIEKDEKIYNVKVSGSAIAEYSYGRWIENSCYSVDDVEVELIN